ncbi:hypothetical protein Pla100_51940 [Neorhodopirellula pilleata]|uniref:Uncharacterized protein n=1 Tax=Neorhodopirellula pilleata TaxID=2714738 RepID=A0A5C5ZW10_9BACT|nr:hypothetical protein Pla100_51940 [Neorhodopirellula pilleata]
MTPDRLVIHAEIDVTIPPFYNLKLDRDSTLRAYPKRSLTLSGETRKATKIDSPPKVSPLFG